MSHLSSLSSQLEALQYEGRYMDLSNKILSLMVKNVDLSPLAGKIINFLAIPYPPCKKVISSFLIKYSSNIADLNILTTNTLLKDFKDPNPFIRKLVIKTVCSIPCLFELGLQLLPQALRDGSPYVRCSAASASSLILNENNIKDNQDIIDTLYGMIRDPDPTVVCSSLTSLNEILHSDGGIVINSKITFYLLSRLSSFDNWNFVVVYSVLKKYSLKNSEEFLLCMNSLDEKLLHENPEIFILAADLAFSYAEQLGKDFSSDIIRQISPSLKLSLSDSCGKVVVVALSAIQTHLPKHKDLFLSFYKQFLCRASDNTYTKVKKLEVVPHLIDTKTSDEIAEELLSHCTNSVKEVSHQAIRSFTQALKSHSELKKYLNHFVSLIDLKHNDTNEEIFNSLCALDINESADVKDTVIAAISKHAQCISNVNSNLSLLKFIGNHGQDIAEASYILEKIINNAEHTENEILMSVVLSTTVRLFMTRPEKMQLILGCVLQNMKESPCLVLQKQAAIYYCLLKNLTVAEKVLQIHRE